MKRLNELLKQEPVFLNDWAESKKIGVLSDFEDVYITKEEYEATECPIPNKDVRIKTNDTNKFYLNSFCIFA